MPKKGGSPPKGKPPSGKGKGKGNGLVVDVEAPEQSSPERGGSPSPRDGSPASPRRSASPPGVGKPEEIASKLRISTDGACPTPVALSIRASGSGSAVAAAAADDTVAIVAAGPALHGPAVLQCVTRLVQTIPARAR